jgi:hypothetical protein
VHAWPPRSRTWAVLVSPVLAPVLPVRDELEVVTIADGTGEFWSLISRCP